MKVITFTATKSMGKSTGVQTLSNALLRVGVPVHVLSLDPQKSHRFFVDKVTDKYPTLFTYTAFEDLGEKEKRLNNFYQILDDLEEKSGVLIIDVQGTENDMIRPAVAAADLVLVPMVDRDMERLEIETTFRTLMNVDIELKRAKGLKPKEHPEPAINVRVYYSNNTLAPSKAGREVLQTADELGFKYLGCNLTQRRQISKLPVNGLLGDPEELTGPEKEHLSATLAMVNVWVKAIQEAL